MSTSAVKRKVYFFLLLIPVILTLYPALQLYRAHAVTQDEVAARQYLSDVREKGYASVRVPYRYARQARASVPAMMAQELEQMEANRGNVQLRWALAAMSIVTAIGALVLGVGIIRKIAADSRRAQREFDFLLDHFEKSWAQVSRLLLLHIGLMLITLLCNVAYEFAWSRANWYTHGFVAIVFTIPLWGAIFCAAKLLLSAFKQLAPIDAVDMPVLGRALARSQAPHLWAWIDDIAARLGAPTPDHIVIGLTESFYVTSAPIALQPENRRLTGRTLYLPMTYVSMLSQGESAAIVGHELGHFANADTEHGVRIALMHRHMDQRIAQLIATNDADPSWFNEPPIWASIYFANAFEHAYLHWSRVQEFAADQAGASVAGTTVSACALVRVTALADMLDGFEQSGQARGGNLIAALLAHAAATPLRIRQGLLDHTIAHPIDSHPPTRARIDALAVPLDDTLLRDALRQPTETDTTWFSRLLSPAAQPA
jgi:Zn-dependent protease with chaperone function